MFSKLRQPDEIEIPTSIAQYVFGTDPIKESGLQLFEVASVAGKGKGLVARFNIAKGTRILHEKPFFTAPNMSPLSAMENRIATDLKALSKLEQRQFLSFHNNYPGKHPFSGIFKTNALPCGPASVVGGVYPTICLINHSCLPNAHNSWNTAEQCETIHAIRHIKSGDEITISYDRGEPSASRRIFLRDKFGFDCNCEICSLSLPDLKVSDAHRRQIQLLDEAIGDSARVVNEPEEALADCRRLLRVLDEEFKGGAGALVGRLYYDAFQICITHGDQARASIFAERGYRARVLCEGEDSPETQNIKKLMEKPSGHRNFGASMRWKTAKERVPKGLDIDAFDNWLWRHTGCEE
jgi:hypothetical protein